MRQRNQARPISSHKQQVSSKPSTTSQDASEDKNAEESSKNHTDYIKEAPASTELANGGRKICGVSLLGIFKVIVLVIVVPPFLNYASLQKEFRSLRPSGELKTLPQGHRLFMSCSGRGLPVVIMDTPGGASSDVWALIQPQVSQFTKLCVYDRAGLGFSEGLLAYNGQSNDSSFHGDVMRKRMQPTTENMASDLQHIIKAISNDSSTIILVGGGLGAVNMRFYARLYENIFGLVLVNSFYEDMFTQDNEWTTFWYEYFIPSMQVQQVLATLGITRLGLLSGLIKPEILLDARLDHDARTRLKYLLCNSEHLTSGIKEHFYINESLAQLKLLTKIKPFPANISVKIISSEKFSSRLKQPLNNFWHKNQEQLKNEVFPRSERTFVKGDFHTVYFDDADIIVREIKKLVTRFRKSVKQTANI